jgi:anti-anti-sigma factor
MQRSIPDGNTANLGRIAIQGSPGLGEAGALREAAVGVLAGASDVIVDCQAAEHLNGAIVQVLVCLKREVEGAGRRFVLANASPAVQRFLEVAGLTQLLSPAAPTVAEGSPSHES